MGDFVFWSIARARQCKAANMIGKLYYLCK